MSAKQAKCQRCGERAETNDNLVGSTFWGAIRREKTTTVVDRVRFLATYYLRNEERESLMRVDDDQPLCSDCWGALVGRFMQGRGVPALAGKEER